MSVGAFIYIVLNTAAFTASSLREHFRSYFKDLVVNGINCEGGYDCKAHGFSNRIHFIFWPLFIASGGLVNTATVGVGRE